MAKSAVKAISDADRVTRYVGYAKLRRDGDGEPVGVLHTAFELRSGEEYLSAAHLDAFEGSDIQRLSEVKAAYDPHPLVVRENGAFTVGIVAEIKETCAGFERPVRIVSAPKKKLGCYVEVRQFRSDDLDLLNALAEDAWGDFTLVKNIP